MPDNKQGPNILQPAIDRAKMKLVLNELKKRMFQLAVDAMLGKKRPLVHQRSNKFNSFRTITTKWMCYINADYVKLYSLDLIFDPNKNTGISGPDDSNREYPFADPRFNNKNAKVDLLSSNNDFQISTYEDDEIPEKYAKQLALSMQGKYDNNSNMFMITPTSEYIITKYLYRIIEKYNLAKNQQNINYNLRAAANASKKNDIEDAVDKTISAITSTSSGRQESKYGDYTNNADTNDYRVGGFKEMQDEMDIIIKRVESSITALLDAVKKYGESSKGTVRGTYKVEKIFTPYQTLGDGIIRTLHERSNNMVRSIMDGQTNLYAILGLRKESRDKSVRSTLRTQVGSESLSESENLYKMINEELDAYLYERLEMESRDALLESQNSAYFRITDFNHSYQDMNNYFLDNAAKALENLGILESESDIRLRKWIQENSYIYTTDTGQDAYHHLGYLSYKIDKAGQMSWLGLNTQNAIYQITLNGKEFSRGCFLAPVFGGGITGSSGYMQLLLKRISNHWNGRLENGLANRLKFAYSNGTGDTQLPRFPVIKEGTSTSKALIPTYIEKEPSNDIPIGAKEERANGASDIFSFFRNFIGGNISKVVTKSYNIPEIDISNFSNNSGTVGTIAFDVKPTEQTGDASIPNYIYIYNIPPRDVMINLIFVDKSSIDSNFSMRGVSVTTPVEAIVVSNNKKN